MSRRPARSYYPHHLCQLSATRTSSARVAGVSRSLGETVIGPARWHGMARAGGSGGTGKRRAGRGAAGESESRQQSQQFRRAADLM